MPAVLIEGGFMSNPAEARWIYSSSERTRLARSIVDAINKHKRATGS
jgi:N-acetylmuramoyl-L-alanine amidase